MQYKHSPSEAVEGVIVALRSGKYEQTKQRLCIRDQDGHCKYCCLGVMCEVFMEMEPEANLETEERPYNYGFNLKMRVYQGTSQVLPLEVQTWMAFKESNPAKRANTEFAVWSFTGLNDDRGYSFEQIAEILEVNLLDNRDGLFDWARMTGGAAA